MRRAAHDGVAPSPLATSSPLVHGRAPDQGPGQQADTIPGSRRAGVLMHVTSIPGPDGIGDLGRPSRDFVDWLSSAGQRLWQTLPLRSPSSASMSPYDSSSAFAGNPLLLSLDDLVELGLLPDTLDAVRRSVGASAAPAGGEHGRPAGRGGLLARTARWKLPLVRQAARQLLSLPAGHELAEAHLAFCTREAWWLADHVAFTALREQHPGVARQDWPLEDRIRRLGARRARSLDIGATHQHPEAAVQFLFDLQHRRLHAHATRSGVWLMGEMSVWVGDDSADVWAHPHLFLLDGEHRPAVRTGSPPNARHPAGQVWPMPAYDWEASATSGHEWWIRRLQREAARADVVRIGNFRSYADWWSVPPQASYGEQGHWEPGPGAAFVDVIRRGLDDAVELVAEDLGESTPALEQLRRDVSLAPVRVLVNGFEEGGASAHLPTSWSGDEVAYTATQELDTVAGWADAAAIAAAMDESDGRLAFALRFTGAAEPAELPRAAIEAVMRSRARLVVVPMQDWLGVDTGAHVDLPGAAHGGWEWVAPRGAFGDVLAEELAAAVRRSERVAVR